MEGLNVKPTIGIGDAIQFTSLPENYFRATGKKLVDTAKHWVFDYNPYVLRDVPEKLDRIYEAWMFKKHHKPRQTVWNSLAEIHACMITPPVPVVLKYPRLYIYEDYPVEKREMILFQPFGVSHGAMPDFVIDHVLKKYKGTPLYQIGLPNEPDLGIPRLKTPTMWDLAEVISKARMFIGMDSGPSWIACCYPDVVVKKLRTKPTPEHFKKWVPLDMGNIHSWWDDRTHMVYNPTSDDIGFTASYRRI